MTANSVPTDERTPLLADAASSRDQSSLSSGSQDDSTLQDAPNGADDDNPDKPRLSLTAVVCGFPFLAVFLTADMNVVSDGSTGRWHIHGSNGHDDRHFNIRVHR